MKYRIIRFISILFITLYLAPALSGQSILNPAKQKAEIQEDTVAAPILPFPVSTVADESSRSMQKVSEAAVQGLTEAEINRMTAEIDALFSPIDRFLNDSLFQTFEGLSTLELENTGNRANIYIDQISQNQSRLSSRNTKLKTVVDGLVTVEKRWQLTLGQASVNKIPATLQDRIGMTIRRIDSVSTLLQGDINMILLQQDRLQDRKNKLESFRGRVQDTRLLRGRRIFSRDMPGFFKDLSSLNDSSLIQRHARQLVKSLRSDAKVFRSEFSRSMVIVVLFFIGLLILLFRVRKNYTTIFSTKKAELTELHLKLLQAPLLVAIFSTTILIRLAIPDLPYTIRSINTMILIVPMVILTIRIFGSVVRRWMVWLAIIYIFTILFELVYFPDILQRIFLLFLSFSGLVMFLWIVLEKPASNLFKQKSLYSLIHSTVIVFGILLFIAFVGNLAGAFSMAEFLTLATIQIAFITLTIQLIISFAGIILYLILSSNYFLRVNVIREYFDVIHQKTSRLVNLFFWLFYMVIILRLLRVKEVFFDWGHKLLTTGRKIGEVEISLKSILVFVFVIWLSLFITKIVRYVLEKDVFVRVSVSKGVPGTIIMLVRIALISCGFLLAAAAAGMELTNLSIVLGAFSVGIGFGLQNIFNNMVSGLIISFERPINVGDVVQVGELMGTVLSIGLRASKIKSFDGAEVIVPNGNLISDSLINWTLSDAYRRMDIRVGVAYGTDPDLVLGIMKEVAGAHALVRKEPTPNAYFLGFGDSSLNFRLLAWVDFENRLGVESALNTSINTRLKEAGIQIPFPQRDLHIRSDATRPESAAKPAAKTQATQKPSAKPNNETEQQASDDSE